MAVKTAIFREADVEAPDHALLASNTSSLSITEMAAASGRPERFAGMHFFNPVHVIKLIELVRGLETSQETLDALATVGRQMGKTIVTVSESPGFVTSRINAMIGNEAFRMLQAGVASAEDIDTALKLGLNHPMGPFEMVDLVGLRHPVLHSRVPVEDPGRTLPAQSAPGSIRQGGTAGPQGGSRRLRLRRKRQADRLVAQMDARAEPQVQAT